MSLKKNSNAEVLDILFAVALGEGFLWGVQNYRQHLVDGTLLDSAETTQGFARVVLAFVIIILSWLHFRSSTLARSHYPTIEFVIDVLVAISYMTLFLFVDAPTAFYYNVTIVWLLYLLARFQWWKSAWSYFAVGSAFVVYFAAIAAFPSTYAGPAFEWIRMALAAAGVVAYRFVDRWLIPNYAEPAMGSER